MTTKPNIILISLDTLRADHLSCYGYPRPTTPHLDQIAAAGVRFNNAYSTAVWTPPAHASMLTGLYPSQHGVVDENKLAAEVPTLAQALQQNGYRTAGFVNNSQVGALVGLERGHEDFYEIWKGLERRQVVKRALHKTQNVLGYADHGAAVTNKMALEWLQNRGSSAQPFYLFIHYIDAHNPLKAPAPFANKYLEARMRRQADMAKVWEVANNPLLCYADNLVLDEAEREALTAIYDEEISYLDYRVGELYQRLKSEGYLDNTLLIVTADHGEHLGEHGHYSHVASLFEPVVHIPFILHFPKLFPGGQIAERLVQLVDIFPLAMSAAEISYPQLRASKNFLPDFLQENRPYVVAEWEGRVPYFIQRRLRETGAATDIAWMRRPMKMLRTASHKLLVSENEAPRLFDLREDPRETHNLAEHAPALAAQLQADLEEWKTQHRAYGAATTYEMDAEIKRHLEALGYL